MGDALLAEVGRRAEASPGARKPRMHTLPMTYDLAVWDGGRPDESNAAETFAALYEQYIGRDDPTPTPPTPAIREYVKSLLGR
jgi:hypothetical protein